jgi:dienelactone hydrolase
MVASGAGTLIVLFALLALAACGGSGTTASSSPSAAAGVATTPVPVQTSTLRVRIPGKDATWAEMKQMYEYDRSEPLAFKETGTVIWVISGVSGELIEYTSAGCKVPGVLVIPEGEGRFPVVLCAPGGTCSPGLYSVDQAALAHMGIASLAIQPPDSRAPAVNIDAGGAAGWIKGNARYVVDLRRALDLLETLPQVDGKRIGFIGHSWGSSPPGALLAGVDQRIKAYVFAYGGGSMRGLDPLLVGEVQDPAQYIPHNRGAAFLFQCSKEDVKVPEGGYSRKRVAALFAATPKPKLFQWVPGGHGEMFPSAQGASRFHRVWLEKHL